MQLSPLAEKLHTRIIRHNLPGEMMKSQVRFVENDPIYGRQNNLPVGSRLPFFLPLLNRSGKAPH
ncbi:hypothetical protein yrohd0001_15530 [Yersinia rohdei ATCC 43380]|nr:hypothetical protein yrohd0001_15530 [Yersinia rohdei ATCC 43380]